MTNVATTIRDVKELNPLAQKACNLLFQECYKAGLTNIFITETYRSNDRQKYLYAQGRTRPGQIVTWTLNSNHSGRLAWDIACSPPLSLYDNNTLNKVGAIAQKLGITWGGQASWVKAGATDKPHFEIKSNWKIPKGYKLEGVVTIPIKSSEKVKFVQTVTQTIKNEQEKEMIYLNETGRKEIRELLRKARDKGIIAATHTNDKIAKYDDIQLLSYQAAVINRTFK